jgi:hypothetical protein
LKTQVISGSNFRSVIYHYVKLSGAMDRF